VEPNDLPNDPHNSVDPDPPDSTLSSEELGGVAAGQIGPYFLLQVRRRRHGRGVVGGAKTADPP
jgi:hypothetical protein